MVDNATGLFTLKTGDRFAGQRKREHLVDQSILVLQGCLPESGNVMVNFHHDSPFDQIFHYRGEGHNSATGERLYQNFRPCFIQPLADMRDKPGFTARVT